MDVPVLERRWHVWLPPGYRPAWADHRYGVLGVQLPSWKQRLLGPLAADPGSRGHFACSARDDWATTLERQRLAGADEGHGPVLLQRLGQGYARPRQVLGVTK